jgi:hypothetical protein
MILIIKNWPSNVHFGVNHALNKILTFVNLKSIFLQMLINELLNTLIVIISGTYFELILFMYLTFINFKSIFL